MHRWWARLGRDDKRPADPAHFPLRCGRLRPALLPYGARSAGRTTGRRGVGHSTCSSREVRRFRMLSKSARPVIEATLPVVGEHIGVIAERFYQHMFAARPDLLDGLFNRGNQAEGTQQVALAGSVAGFAHALLQDPEQLPEHLLARVAHKHASLGLRPDQYDIVHEHLFWAIADVLGRGRHPRGGRRVGRGVLADGVRADPPGARSVQRSWGAAGDRVAAVAGGREDLRDQGRRDVRGAAHGSAVGAFVAARPVRLGEGAHARRRPPAAAVQPDPRRRRRAPPVLRQAGPRRSTRRTGRSRTCCATPWRSATS